MANAQCNQSARVLTLQGQLIQEAVLAEELQKAEAQQQRRLRRLEVEATSQLEGRKDQEMLQHLQHLQAQMPSSPVGSQHPLQLRLAQLELDAQALEQGATCSEILERLRAEEQQLSDETRSERGSEQVALEEMEAKRAEVLSLKAECSAAPEEQPPKEVVERELRNSLPPNHPVLRIQHFDDLLAALELEKGKILEELSEDSAVWQVQREVEELSEQLLLVEEATRRRSQKAQAVRRQIQESGQAVAEIDDLHAQAAALEKENQILSRQQAEWRRSQNLMLRLAEDQRPGRPELQSEPGPAGRHREAGEEASKAVQEVLLANEGLRQKIERLQQEKADLVHSHQGLESFIRSRMTAIEAKLTGNSVSPYPPSP